MESLDLRVLGDVLAWHQAGHRVTLVTVVETWGSAPRPPGALLAVRDDGVVSGSVSGGCVEDDLIARIKAGEYAIPPGTTPRSLLALFESGAVIQHSVTIVEGWTFRDLRKALEAGAR